MEKHQTDKYLYDKALDNIRIESYKLSLELRVLESAEFDSKGDIMGYVEYIPLTDDQQRIMWNHQ